MTLMTSTVSHEAGHAIVGLALGASPTMPPKYSELFGPSSSLANRKYVPAFGN